MSEIASSYSQLSEFKQYSPIWHDIEYVLNEILEDLRTKLEIEESLPDIYRFQGRIEAIRIALDAPDLLLRALETKLPEVGELPDEEDDD